jgi:hypothetical protein
MEVDHRKTVKYHQTRRFPFNHIVETWVLPRVPRTKNKHWVRFPAEPETFRAMEGRQGLMGEKVHRFISGNRRKIPANGSLTI